MAAPSTTLSATISRVSEHGFQTREIPGRWYNLSKFVEPVPTIPPVGSEVEFSVNAKGYVVEISRTDSPPETRHDPSPDGQGRAVRRDFVEADTLAVRMGCLSAAAAFLAGRAEAKSGDVLRVAENWEAWATR